MFVPALVYSTITKCHVRGVNGDFPHILHLYVPIVGVHGRQIVIVSRVHIRVEVRKQALLSTGTYHAKRIVELRGVIRLLIPGSGLPFW